MMPELSREPAHGPHTSTCPECGGVMEETHGLWDSADECRDCGYRQELQWQEPDFD